MSAAKKAIRQKFNFECLKRDSHSCRVCKSTFVELDVHHITDRTEMPNGGYAKENGISLCRECHKKAEVWHISNKKEFIPGLHPNELYALIRSSYGLAIKASERLSKE